MKASALFEPFSPELFLSVSSVSVLFEEELFISDAFIVSKKQMNELDKETKGTVCSRDHI